MIRILKQKQNIVTKYSLGISTKQQADKVRLNKKLRKEKRIDEFLDYLKKEGEADENQDEKGEPIYSIDNDELKLMQKDMLENRFGFVFDQFLDHKTYKNLTKGQKQKRLELVEKIEKERDLYAAKMEYLTLHETITLQNSMVKEDVPYDYEEDEVRDKEYMDIQLKMVEQGLKDEGIKEDSLPIFRQLKIISKAQNQDVAQKEDNYDQIQEFAEEQKEGEVQQEGEVQLENEGQDQNEQDECFLEVAEIDEVLNPDDDLQLAIRKEIAEYLEKKTGKSMQEIGEIALSPLNLKKTLFKKEAGEEEAVEEQQKKENEKQSKNDMNKDDGFKIDYMNIRNIKQYELADSKNEINMSLFYNLDNDQRYNIQVSAAKKFLDELVKARCQPFQKASDYQRFIMQKEFQSIIYVLFNKRIYLDDNSLITNLQISQIMQFYDKDKCYNQLLELIKNHYQFVNIEQKTQLFSGLTQCSNFLSKYSQQNDFNYLNFSYHLIRLCQSNIMEKVDQDDLIYQFLRISIDDDKLFYEKHKDLLFHQYKVQKNTALRSFLFDTFYTAKNYEIGILQYLMTIQILARIQQEKPCQDLLKMAQRTFGVQFDNLFNNILPCILRQLPNRNIYEAYMNKNQKTQTQRITYFDNQILKHNSNVTMFYDENVDVDYVKSQHFQIKYSDQINHNQLLHVRKSEPQYKYDSRQHYQHMLLNNDKEDLFNILNTQFKSLAYAPYYNVDGCEPKEGLQILYDKFNKYLDDIEQSGLQVDEFFLQLNDLEEQNENEDGEELPDYMPLENKPNVQSSVDEADMFIPEVKQLKKGLQDQKLDNMVKDQISQLNKKKNNLLNKSYANFCTDNKPNDEDKFKQFLQKQKEIDINTKLTINEVEQLKEQLQIKSQASKPRIEVNEVENLLKNINDFSEQQQAIMKQLETQTLQNQSSEQIQRFIQQMIKDYNQLLIHMFFDQECAFSKYPMPTQAYTQFLNNLKDNYSRNSFRHVLNHFAKANIESKKEKIQLVIQMSNLLIDKNQRTVYFELVRQDEILTDEQIVIHLVGGLTKFVDSRNEIADLIKRYLIVNENAKFKMELIQEFIQAQRQKSDYSEIMILFEQIKDNLLAKKPQFDKQTPSDQIVIIQRQHKESITQQMHLFYQDIIQFLNQNRRTKEAQILFQDMMNQKYDIEERDFINGFQCNQDNAIMTVKIFTAVETYKKEMINKNFFKIISINIISNSLYMHDLFEKIVKDYILTNKNLDQEIIEITLKMFEALPIGSLFADFLKVIISQHITMTERQKINCYNVLQTCQDQNSKSFIKGLINQIYDKDRIKSINKYKGRQDGQEILNSMFQEKVEREIVEYDGWNDLMKLYAKPISAIMNRGKNKRKRTSYQAKTYLEFISFDEELECQQLREKHR